MAVSALMIALIAGAVASLAGAGLSTWSAFANQNAQKEINAENVEAQRDINTQNVQAQAAINQQNIDYSKEFAQNQVQWKMADMEAAGLNPTLAAGGIGGSSSPTALSVPTQKAAMQQAPLMDFSGVSSALNAMTNMMMTSAILGQRNDNYAERNDILRERYLNNGVYRKMNAASTMINHSKQLQKAWSAEDEAEWKRVLKDISKVPGAEKFKSWWK